MSDGPLFMTLLLRNLNDLLDSNAYSVVLIKEEIGWVKEDLEHIRSFFGNVEQELHRDLWTRVLDVAYEAEHAINSILARDHGLLQLIFLLPDIVEKIKLVKKEVQEKISKNTSIIFANSPNKPVINKSSIAGKIIVGFKEETKRIIRNLTSGPAEIDVISIVGMPGLGKTTLAYRVYNEKSVVGHFDVRAWCTVDQERNQKKLLQKIFNQVNGLKGSFNEEGIDDDIADKLRKHLFGKRYLIVLDDLWDTATWDELTRPLFTIPSEFQNGSRVILTSRKKEVALHGKCHSDPLDLRLLRPEESWELLEKRVFGEEHFPDELKDVGAKIAEKCNGLPLVLDLIGGVISRKEKKQALWLEVLNNLSSFIFKDEEEVMKVIQLSYDHLSDHLKPCFLYLASYPKDKNIRISWLKDLWSDEGLVEPTDMKSVEDVTEVYVDELISSSLVIVRGGRHPSFQIHNLVHDFCSIKARMEKLFDLTSSIFLSSSSSSHLTLRRRTIIYDECLHSSDTSSLFSPEERYRYIKHLPSLKIDCGPSKVLPRSRSCHLRHLRLLKRLELRRIILTDTLLNEIDIDKPTKLENLTTLMLLKLSCSVDSGDIFKRFPNLRILRFRIDCTSVYFPRLDVLNKLERVYAEFECFERTRVHQFDFHFPSNLKKVCLDGFNLTSDALSGIGRSLPNLQMLILFKGSIQGGKEWKMEQVTFHNLKSLQVYEVSFSEWLVTADESFPLLEILEIIHCNELIEIPESFGDIASLKSIRVWGSPQLKESAHKIKEYVEEMMGEDKLEFVKYDGHGDPVPYLRCYWNQLRGARGKEELLMAYFGLASEWFVDQDIDKWNSWDDLANEFVQQFQYNMELIPDDKSLTNMNKKSTKTFRVYAIRWREQAARVKPPMKENKIVEAFIQAQDETYYQHLLPALVKPFIEVLKMGEIIEDRIKIGLIMSFATLKATTQAIQKGSGSVGGKKNEEDASAMAVGQQARTRGQHHCYPRAQTQVYAQAPQNLYQNPLYFIPPPPYQVYTVQPYVQPPSYPHWRVPTLLSHPPTPHTY
ncbi:hypothetical protein T459_34954 [Capsicum annuum]|uniref:Uncharacterized protein n=1 Tax=Capsicum annuum TaxID=4072 RepID=A0A2G2XUN1_CAPAN|nr:hypothetical protein T459_34954 [Capsicum annuum]